MFAQNLVKNNYPTVKLTDKISFALRLMDDYDVQHLCVTSQKKFIALISKNDLLDTDENNSISTLQASFIHLSVKVNELFTEVLKIFSTTDITIVPVVDNENNLEGIISQIQLLNLLADVMNVNETGAMIILEIERRNFSFGEICRLVETNDAYITQLNTMVENENTNLVILKINKNEVSDIVATFQRYDYVVKYFSGEEYYHNELQENYEHLLSYLNV